MNSNKLYTPLRYPGGKARFAPFIAALMGRNKLEGGHYLEPYAGGAGVALELLFHGHATHVHINDIDPAVGAFWVAVTRHHRELLQLLKSTRISMTAWHHWRSVMRGETAADVVERGFATLFMNRTNRSGILKAGVIGGLSQSGFYKLTARLKKSVLAHRIERIAERSGDITVYSEDARGLLRRCHKFLPEKSLIYLDPPYYLKGSGLYRNFYGHDDHVSIATLIQSVSFARPWVVSYDNVPEIRRMYRGCRQASYGLSYTAQERYVGSEVMFFGPGLSVPVSALPNTELAA